ncbi:MAG: SEC-C domain-containing protein [Burkholderiaceae bacterium]|nr:SEC-C domain-containing protein [Burkholderiaceae bacterium]
MPMTIRLPADLHAEGQAYAEKLGIAFTALMAVALRDYLDGRRAMPRSGKPSPSEPVDAPSSSPATSVPPPVRVPSLVAPAVAFKPPKNPRAPCPCGSKAQWRHCHGRA